MVYACYTAALILDIFLFQCGGVRATTGKLQPQNRPSICNMFLFRYWYFFDFWMHNPGVACIVRPCLDYWVRVLCRMQQVCQELCVPKSSTIVFSLLGMLEDHLVQQRTLLHIHVHVQYTCIDSFWLLGAWYCLFSKESSRDYISKGFYFGSQFIKFLKTAETRGKVLAKFLFK